jgi:energy-coupling factor transporter ATP-binding protein EcfA2
MTTSARWILELQRQLRRGKHVVLHGNVRDLVLLQGAFQPFSNALDQVLDELGYMLRCQYNLVDGVVFPDHPDLGMRRRFDARIADPDTSAPPPSGGYAVPGRQPAAVAVAEPLAQADLPIHRRPPYLADPERALGAFRRLLTGPDDEPAAVVFDFSDKILTGDQHQPADERRLLVRLGQITSEGRRISRPGPMAGMRNAVVLVASNLGQLPAWLYRDHPLFHVISISRPDAQERQEFFRQRYGMFHGGQADARPPEPVLDELATLTDGLTHWDLEALRLASHHEGLPVTEPRRLVDFFKHGTHEDPWERLSMDTLQQAEAELRAKVIGQEAAIQAVRDVLVSARGGVQLDGSGRGSVRPKGVLFFVGPTGVGKTELAKALTELIFKDPTAFARFDMSEYAQEHAAERLTGAPPSYVGYEAGGQLTNRMKAKPFSLILFDEIEKAHARIMDKFLQVLDDGRLTDGLGDTVYFSQSIIVFTSNIGSTRILESEGRSLVTSALHPDMSYDDVQRHYREEVKNHFIRMGRPELLGRIGEENIVVFDMLRADHVGAIADKFLRAIAASARDKYALTFNFDTSVLDAIREDCRRPEVIQLGGRGIRNFVQSRMLPRINEAVLRHARGSTLRLAWRHGALDVSVE